MAAIEESLEISSTQSTHRVEYVTRGLSRFIPYT